MNLPHPVPGEYHPQFQRYVNLVTESDIPGALEAQVGDIRAALGALPAECETHRYEPGKWSVRQVLGHMLDNERIFGYRMLAVARGELRSLPGFDENAYALVAGHDRTKLKDLLDEFEHVRLGHLALLRGFDDLALARIGNANGNPIVARAFPFLMIGHARHHLAVLASKYGVPR